MLTLRKTIPAQPVWGLLPPAWFGIAAATMLGLGLLLPAMTLIPFPFNLVGAPVIALGLWLIISAARQIKKSGTTIKPFALSSKLVTDGLYKRSRNPIYLGMTVALIGLAVTLGAFTSTLIPPLFAAWITLAFIRPEEHSLFQQYGEKYLAYRNATPRWI